jgi:hypothetical protein
MGRQIRKSRAVGAWGESAMKAAKVKAARMIEVVVETLTFPTFCGRFRETA